MPATSWAGAPRRVAHDGLSPTTTDNFQGMHMELDDGGAAVRNLVEKFVRREVMPLENEYLEMIKSDVADMKNSGGRWGGAITAALFLREFVEEGIPWAHLDIAGPALVENDRPYRPAGGTGVMVRTLLRYLEEQ